MVKKNTQTPQLSITTSANIKHPELKQRSAKSNVTQLADPTPTKAEIHGRKKTAVQNNAKRFDQALYQKYTDRVEYDAYGNQLVEVSPPGSAYRRFLVSNRTLHYPSTAERDAGKVDGCMTFKYYVNQQAFVTMIIAEDSLFRMHHSLCEYDHQQLKYTLTNQNQMADELINSISAIITLINSDKKELQVSIYE